MSDNMVFLGDEPDDVGKLARAISRAVFGKEELCWVDLPEERRRQCTEVAKDALRTREEIRDGVVAKVEHMLLRLNDDIAVAVDRLKSVKPFGDKADVFDSVVRGTGVELCEFRNWLGKVMR